MPRRLCTWIPTLVLLLFALPAAADAPTSWVWQNPLPQGNSSKAVWGRSATEVYAIGGQETLLRWDGASWLPTQRPISLPIEDMWGLDSGVLLAAGYGGTVLRYDGVNWSEIPTDFDDNLIAILAFSETEIYVAERFPGNRVRRYDGVAWTIIGTAPDGVHDLGGSGPSDIYIVGFEGMMSHYDGASWTPIPGFSSIDITSVWSNATDDVFALQQASILHHYDGLGWSQVASDATVSWQSDMWGTSANDVWFVDQNGGVSHYDGDRVTEYDVPNDGLVGIWGDELGMVHAAGDHGSVLRFDGTEWTAYSTAAAYEKLNAVWGLAPDDLYAVGSLEIALHYDGLAWSQIHSTSFSTWFSDVWAAATDDVFMVGKKGITHYDGVTWTPMDDGLRQMLLPQNSIWGFGPNDIVVVGDWGAIVRYDGQDWSIIRDAVPSQGNLLGVWGAAPDDIWAVGPQGEFLHWEGQDWTLVPVSTLGQQTEIIGWASDDIYALGAGGELFHYDGVAWTLDSALIGQGVTSIHGTSSSDLYALTTYGYVWHYDGVQWTSSDTEARTGLQAIWASPEEAFAVGSGGSVLHSSNKVTDVPELSVGSALHLRSHPNPFNPSTSIRFEMPEAGRATLRIHDVAGHTIATLFDGQLGPGWKSVTWDGRDQAGRRQASGIYFASVRTEDAREVIKLTLVK